MPKIILKTDKKGTIITIIGGIILGIALIILSEKGYRKIVEGVVIPILFIIFVGYELKNRKKIREGEIQGFEKRYAKWNALILSWLVPGLGQVVYAEQWKKMFFIWLGLLSTGVLGFGFIFFMMYKAQLGKYIVSGPLMFAPSFILLFFIIVIWNLYDAYKIGKKVGSRDTAT